jgi:hypothetical protein
MRLFRLVLVPSLALGLLLVAEPRAQACSGCSNPSRVAPPGGTAMPANAIGIAWAPSSELPAGTLPVLYDEASGQALPVESIPIGGLVYVRPMDAAEAGKSYRFETPPDSCSNGRDVTLDATQTAIVPSVSLGALVATAPTLGEVSVPADVTCSEDVEAVFVDIELQLPAELQPFVDALMYTTYVDGEPWSHTPAYFHELRPGSSWTGRRGGDRLLALCIDGQGGSPEPHSVQMVARIVGAPQTAYESETIEVILDCSMIPESGTDGGTDTGGDTDTAGGADGGGSGCACHVDGGSGMPMLLPTMLALLGLAPRRRAEHPEPR